MRTGALALEIKGVTVKFGGLTALNNVDLVVPNGGVVAVIGPNGSGKSTLFNVVTGLLDVGEGSVRFHGEEIMRLPPHEILTRGIARTFQNLRLFPNLTVMENALVAQHSRLTTGVLQAILRARPTPAPRKSPPASGLWKCSPFSAIA